MSEPDQNNPYGPSGQPQFGQRSDSWSSGSSAPSGEPEQQSPWPVYGQTGQPSSNTPAGGPYSSTANSQSSWSPNGQNPGTASYQASPPATPFIPAGARPTGPPPSRGGAIALLVVGIVTMVIVAPIVFFSVLVGGVIGGMDLTNLSSFTTTNGGEVTVDETGTILLSASGTMPDSCQLLDESGSAYPMAIDNDVNNSFYASQLVPGTYTVDCAGASGTSFTVMGGDMINAAGSSGLAAFGWGSLVGVIGLGMTIWGIVWLVKRNRARKAYFAGMPY